jgi:phage terminase large subunit-like protein
MRRAAELKPFQWNCHVPGCDGKPHKGTLLTAMPHKHARATQLPPPGDWWAWFLMAGRGVGKTRTGAEWSKERLMSGPKHRLAIIAPDFAVGRDVCIEGESGLIPGGDINASRFPAGVVTTWNRSLGEVILANGSMIKLFGTDKQKDAEKLRGFQMHSAWFEELGTQQFGQVAWDMLTFALRLGDDPRVIITSTPRPIPLIRALVEDDDVVVTTGSTYDNADNLPPRQLERIKAKYEGTNLGQQELHGLLLDGAKGALWKHTMFRRSLDVPPLVRIVIGVDPAGTAHKTSDLTGIVIVGIDAISQLWVLGDKSGQYSPEQWRVVVRDAYNDYAADLVVGEVNYGGDLVASNLRALPPDEPRLPFKKVTASRGKAIRATPVVGLYEQKRVIHVGTLGDLEGEMTTWVPPGQFDEEGQPIPPSKDSPDHMDATVWAITELAGLSRPARRTTKAHAYED